MFVTGPSPHRLRRGGQGGQDFEAILGGSLPLLGGSLDSSGSSSELVKRHTLHSTPLHHACPLHHAVPAPAGELVQVPLGFFQHPQARARVLLPISVSIHSLLTPHNSHGLLLSARGCSPPPPARARLSFSRLSPGRRTEPAYAAAHALVAPHIAGFDALFEGAHLPGTPDHEVAPSSGLLALAVADLVPKVFFDGRGEANGGRGNRIES